jgi:hypothetical protein
MNTVFTAVFPRFRELRVNTVPTAVFRAPAVSARTLLLVLSDSRYDFGFAVPNE